MVGRFLDFGARDIGRFLGYFHLCASAGWWQDNMKDIHSYLSVFGDGALRVKTVFAGCGSRESAAEPIERLFMLFVCTGQGRRQHGLLLDGFRDGASLRSIPSFVELLWSVSLYALLCRDLYLSFQAARKSFSLSVSLGRVRYGGAFSARKTKPGCACSLSRVSRIDRCPVVIASAYCASVRRPGKNRVAMAKACRVIVITMV